MDFFSLLSSGPRPSGSFSVGGMSGHGAIAEPGVGQHKVLGFSVFFVFLEFFLDSCRNIGIIGVVLNLGLGRLTARRAGVGVMKHSSMRRINDAIINAKRPSSAADSRWNRGGGVLWSKPIVRTVILPAHAEGTNPDAMGMPTTTVGPALRDNVLINRTRHTISERLVIGRRAYPIVPAITVRLTKSGSDPILQVVDASGVVHRSSSTMTVGTMVTQRSIDLDITAASSTLVLEVADLTAAGGVVRNSDMREDRITFTLENAQPLGDRTSDKVKWSVPHVLITSGLTIGSRNIDVALSSPVTVTVPGVDPVLSITETQGGTSNSQSTSIDSVAGIITISAVTLTPTANSGYVEFGVVAISDTQTRIENDDGIEDTFRIYWDQTIEDRG